MSVLVPVPGCDGSCVDNVIARSLAGLGELASFVKAVGEIAPHMMDAHVQETVTRYLAALHDAIEEFHQHAGTPDTSAFVEASRWWHARVAR